MPTPPQIPTRSQHQDRDHDENHPDAPLPLPQPYRDDPDLESLAEYEPRPIDEEAEAEAIADAATAAESRPRTKYAAKVRIFWLRNKGMVLVLLAQMFGASMNVMTQILEIHSSMHPFQVSLPLPPLSPPLLLITHTKRNRFSSQECPLQH